MIYQICKRHIFYTAFVAILAIGLLTMSDLIVRSERAVDTKPSLSKFGPLPEPKQDIPDLASALPLTGQIERKWTTDFGSSQVANAVAVQTDGKIVAAGTVISVGSSGSHNYDFAVFRYNADGSPDTSFDGDGKITTPINSDFNSFDIAYTVAIQTDGKIIAAGNASGSNGSTAALVRYNTDGSLDQSFGTGGKVTNAGLGAIVEIAIQTDGKIVAACSGFSIARYNANGSLDTSFGTAGIASTNFGNPEQRVFSVTVQADGKIVAAGDTGFCDEDYCYFDFALARYNTNGSPDSSFDGDGKLTTTFGGVYASAVAVLVQTDGKIVAAGDCGGFAAARYNADGSLDTSFDGDGKVTTGFGNSAFAAALQSDGKILVSGYILGAIYDFALLRLNTDGSLDTSFDGDGTLTTDIGVGLEYAYDVAVQTDGRIVAAGSSSEFAIGGDHGNPDFALSRYNADGSLDAGFDADGIATTALLTLSSVASAVAFNEPAFDPGKIVVAGYTAGGSNDDFSLATYTEGGDSWMKKIIPVGSSDDRANAVTIDPTGRIVAAGYSNNGSNSDFALVRVHANTVIDNLGFGVNGRVTTDFGGNDEASAVAVQADRKILVVGQSNTGGGPVLVLARYNDNGSLDTSFGTGGRIILEAIQFAKAIAIQPDGKIIAAGLALRGEPEEGACEFALARFHPDGSLDTSFDGDGIATTVFNHASQINSIALQPYGKIVAAGFTRNPNGSISDFALARYHSNGSHDTSFDGDGKVTTTFAPQSGANAVSVQRNGKIVAVGVSFDDVSAGDFALARYNSNGSLDTTFNNTGTQTTDFFFNHDVAFGAAIGSYGRIYAAGYASQIAKTDLAVARYIGDETQARVNSDYDGDGLADISVFRPSDSVWYLDRSTEGFRAVQWGISTDKVAPADYDRDGKTDIAVFRDGTWFLLNSEYNFATAHQFGLAGDVPVPADYDDGDGRAELVIYRSGVWWSLNLRNDQVSVVNFGLPGDKPVPADYDADGRADQAVYRNGEWHLNRSSQGYTVIQFGVATDKPVPADYDGDGRADLAVFRDGTWYLWQTTDGLLAFEFGLPTDIPAPADYDGDGKTDAAVYRDGTWYLRQSTSGFAAHHFGLAGDKPLPAAYLP